MPCLVTDVGGNGEIIEDEKNGLLISPYSAGSIAEGIKKLCDVAVRDSMQKSICRFDYSKFDDTHVDEQLKSVYYHLF